MTETPLGWPREAPRVSIVIPVYEEGEAVVPVLDRILENVHLSCEVLVVYDDPADSTVPVLVEYARRDRRVRPVHNTDGRGPARAIRFGVAEASAPVAVVTMADGSDDPQQIDDLTKLVERGVVIAAASRYMSGGRQIGGPPLKSALSRLAGISLYWLGRVGTRDATNSFKAYSTAFVAEVGIESDAGFEIGIELVAKARRRRRRVAEIPTIWLERSSGNSSFQVARWMPRYFYWYRYAFGPKLAGGELAPAASAEPEPERTLA